MILVDKSHPIEAEFMIFESTDNMNDDLSNDQRVGKSQDSQWFN